MKTQPSRISSGFTLVELLVVVTIIVLLAAMLVPAMEQAVVAGQRARCLSNIHAQHTGIMQYALDNRGWFAPSLTNANSPDYHQISTSQSPPGNAPDNRVVKMRPYVPNGEVTLCPLLRHIGVTWARPDAAAGGFAAWDVVRDNVHITTPYMWLVGFTLSNGEPPTMIDGEPEPPLTMQESSARHTFLTHRIDYFLWEGQVLVHDWGHMGGGTGQPAEPYDSHKTAEMPIGTGDGGAFLRTRDEMKARMVIGSDYPNPANPGFPGTYIW